MKNTKTINVKATEESQYLAVYAKFGYRPVGTTMSGARKKIQLVKDRPMPKEIRKLERQYSIALKRFPVTSAICIVLGIVLIIVGAMVNNYIALAVLVVIGSVLLGAGLFYFLTWLFIRLNRKKVLNAFLIPPNGVGKVKLPKGGVQPVPMASQPVPPQNGPRPVGGGTPVQSAPTGPRPVGGAPIQPANAPVAPRPVQPAPAQPAKPSGSIPLSGLPTPDNTVPSSTTTAQAAGQLDKPDPEK